MRYAIRYLTLVASILLAGVRLSAQQAVPQSAVRVQVVDSTGTPLGNADVSVVAGLANVIASGVTDPAGLRTLTIPSIGSYQVVVRRLGYLRGNQFFSATPGPMALRVQLVSSPAALPTISVTADASPYYKAYHLGADEIAASTRPMVDAVDVMTVLRPDMMNAYTPTVAVGGIVLEPCNLQQVWVNGERISLVDQNERLTMVQGDRRSAIQATKPRGASGAPGLMPTGIASASLQALSILASIHPEHIEEISYEDCNSTVVERAHARNAAFVILKPGVKFEPNRGSFVDEMPLAIAGNRMRVIGVYDDATGEPLPGVEIVDETGTYITTTETGTAHLAFLADGAHRLRIRKSHYSEQTIDINISAAELAPITLTLATAKDS